MCQSGGRASRQLHKLQPGQYGFNMAWIRSHHMCMLQPCCSHIDTDRCEHGGCVVVTLIFLMTSPQKSK